MKTLLKLLMLLCALGVGMNCRAAIPGQMNEDIDIFLLNAAIPAEVPNVLIIWDNTANWGQTLAGGSAYDLEKAALSQVIANLPVGAGDVPLYNVGLMLFTETGGGNSNVRGSYPRYHIQPMNAANKAALSNLIAGLHQINDRGSNAQYAKAMHEAYLYLGGRKALAGAGQVKRDLAAFGGDPKSDTYVSPISDGCQKNYIVLISNGTTDSGENNEAQKLLTGLKGVAPKDPIILSPNGEQANWADEYSRFMNKNGVHPKFGTTSNAKTFTIAVYDQALFDKGHNPTQSQIALSKSQAKQGDGEFFAGTDLSSIVSAFQRTFARIKDVDSVFAASTLPVSVNVRGTFVNQVYVGVFRPDPTMAPRWLGNIKMYKILFDSNTRTFYLADADGVAAENATTGFVKDTARSHWTSTSTFWSFEPPDADGVSHPSDNPDGFKVERGAVAQRIRAAWPTRNVYTCAGAACVNGVELAKIPFAVGNTDITAAALTPPAVPLITAAERDEIINWTRGQDNVNDENQDGLYTDVRASVHGDVLHSRPAVINYNRNSPSDDNDIYVFYGSNDGMFRAVKGGFESGANAGSEAWSFVMPEFFNKLKRLRDNSAPLSPTTRRDYFADGSIGIYQLDKAGDDRLVAADGDKVHIYVSMRRGGRLLYALDVSDPLTPKLLWKVDNTTSGFSELGYTWSEPKVARVRGHTNPVIIMGAGYDPNQDNESVVAADTMGRGIMIIDAFTGDLIWQAGPSPSGAKFNLPVAGMIHSIPSDVAIVDRDRNRSIDRLYVGDTGGNVWRVDVNDLNPANWAVNQLASIAGIVPADKRKFLHAPDVVFSTDSTPVYDAVLMGSGDREHPFDIVVQNRYYMFKDFNTTTTPTTPTITTEADLVDVTNLDTEKEIATNQSSLDKQKGWMLRLLDGEKVVSGSITVSGSTVFNTNQPTSVASAECTTNLGIARQYVVSFENALPVLDMNTDGVTDSTDRSKKLAQGGFASNPFQRVVKGTDDKGQDVYGSLTITGTGIDEYEKVKVGARFRTYWYLRTD